MKQQDSDAKDHCVTGMMTPEGYKRFVQKLICCHQEESQKGNEDSIAGVPISSGAQRGAGQTVRHVCLHTCE